MIDKYNVIDEIETFLKKENIRFNQTYKDNLGANYELLIGSFPGYIQIEFTDTNDVEDTSVYFSFYTKLDSSGHSLYSYDIESDSSEFDLGSDIEELVTNIKKINTAIGKIENKIDQIIELCDEYNLDYGKFITIEYDF